MFTIYILQSKKTDKYYIGSTGNLDDRLLRHNSGRSKATKHGIPWELVYKEEFETRYQTMVNDGRLEKTVHLLHH